MTLRSIRSWSALGLLGALSAQSAAGEAALPDAALPDAVVLDAAGATTASEPRLTGFVVPTFSYDSDDLFGYGARGEIARVSEGYAPYKWSLMAQYSATTGGFAFHRIRFDRTGLGEEHRWRLTVRLAWRQWGRDGYWGIGDDTLRLPPSAFPDARTAADFYRYGLFQPQAYLTARWALQAGSPWMVYGALNPKDSRVVVIPGSLLDEERPYGTEGGRTITTQGGVLYDSRAPEIAPRDGLLAEATAGWSPTLSGEAGGYGGPHLSLSAYQSLGGRLVLASRLMGEALFGTVPFYEMVSWLGFEPVVGFGGAMTLRGVPYGRWRGPHKAVLNNELRWSVLEHPFVFGRPLGWELAPFIDLGQTWGAAYEPALPHAAAGLGLRLIFDRTFVGRVDAGYGLDAVQAPDGGAEAAPSFGFYVAFDHPY